MNLFSLMSFLACISYLYLGIRSYRADRNLPLNRSMLYVCISIAIWAFAYTFIYPAETAETCAWWYRFSLLGWGTIPAVSLYLFLVLTGYVEAITRRLLGLLLVVPAAACIILANIFVITPGLFTRVPHGWVAVYDITSMWIWIYVFYYCSFFGAGFVMLLVWGRHTHIKREKKQAGIIITTVMISLVFSSVFDNILPILGIVRFPLIAPIVIMIWVFGTWYAIVKYRFMSLSTAIAADEVIASMRDLLVLADYRGVILQMNPHARGLLGYGEPEISGKSIREIMEGKWAFLGEGGFPGELGEGDNNFEVDFRTSGGDLIPVELSASAFRDREGDLMGVAFVGHDLREAKKLGEMLRMAERDMKMAARLQADLLPTRYPDSGEWDMHHVFLPVASVSGDFYDFYETEGRLSGVGLFDVSGHGVSSGLITIIAKSILFRAYTLHAGESLGRIVTLANRELVREIGHIDNYITGIMLRLRGDIVEYVNAGHTELLRKRGDAGVVEQVRPRDRDVKGPFLGIPDLARDYAQVNFKTRSGDRILLYSDSMLETTDGEGEQFGIERLMAAFEHAPSEDPRDILNHLVGEIRVFAGGKPFMDDLTAILLERK